MIHSFWGKDYIHMSKKSTNFELLRILLTIFIPLYHWLLYNGIFYAQDSSNSIISLVLFSAIPFSCLYAFIAMSSYFLIKKKYQWSLKKVLIFATMAITLFVFKYVFIHVLFIGRDMYSFIYDFFIHGAWWYVYPYILVMIFYPLLNRFIFKAPIPVLYVATFLFGSWFMINSYNNDTQFLNDCVMFLFLYLTMGCLERHEDSSAFYEKHKKGILLTIYTLGILLATGLCIYFKLYATSLSPMEIEGIIQKIHGRYTIIGFVCGIAIFTLFRHIEVPYKPVIHQMSKITLYVFLLHETVMSVFWRYEIKGIEGLAYLPEWQFFLLLFVYFILCVGVAYIMFQAYSTYIAPLWNKGIEFLCNKEFVKTLENKYEKL